MIIKTITTICAFSALAFAQPDQQTFDAADELAEIIGLKDQMETGFNAMLPIVMQQAKQMNLNEDQTEQLKGIYKSWFMEDFDHESVTKEMIQLYAEEFTAEELKELTAFYKTPIGIKSLKALPQLMTKGAQIGAKEGQAKEPELMKRLQPLLEQIKK